MSEMLRVIWITVLFVVEMIGVVFTAYALIDMPLRLAADGARLLNNAGAPAFDREWQRPLQLLRIACIEPLVTLASQIGLALLGYAVIDLRYIVHLQPLLQQPFHAPQLIDVALSSLPALLLLGVPALAFLNHNSLVRATSQRLLLLLALRLVTLLVLASTRFSGLLTLVLTLYFTRKPLQRWAEGVRHQQSQAIGIGAEGVLIPPHPTQRPS